jgi:hypothetical protein
MDSSQKISAGIYFMLIGFSFVVIPSFTEITSSFSQLTELILNYVLTSEAAVLVGIISLFITVYRVFYLQPALFLHAKHKASSKGTLQDDYDTGGVVTLFLINGGNQYAEDVQLTITLDAFKFDVDTTSGESPTEEYDIGTTLADVRSGRVMPFIGGGQRHDIYLENSVYSGDVLPMFFGSTEMDDGEHCLHYTVSCRAKGPTSGHIRIRADDGDIEILEHDYPTTRRNILSHLLDPPSPKRTYEVDNS